MMKLDHFNLPSGQLYAQMPLNKEQQFPTNRKSFFGHKNWVHMHGQLERYILIQQVSKVYYID